MSFYIAELVRYGIDSGLLPKCEEIYATNLLLDCFHEKEYNLEQKELPADFGVSTGEKHSPEKKFISTDPEERMEGILAKLLAKLLAEAVRRGIIEDNITTRDLFDTRLMNCLVPRPAQIRSAFAAHYAESPQQATEYYYKLSQDTNYIRRYRIKKDMKWKVDTPYGQIDITINLSKPEKDPKAIAAARVAKSSSYPKCLLCAENEGYAGHMNHPARENHRIIPLTLNGEPFGFQYSPYVYYNEHCIVFNQKHVPMKIDRAAFRKLFDFVERFPHYFLGSNADLPIVGGSILSHDHFQGGHYTFAMAQAPIELPVTISGYEDVEAGIVKWPLSVLRIRHKDTGRLVDLAEHVLTQWRSYSDEQAMIFAETDGEPHNTITPIARKSGELFEMDLTLRNNLTTREHPLGLYHPHVQYHHIKKENIGLIEVMGLAVLPARLKNEMHLVREAILAGKDIAADERIRSHAEWVQEVLPHYERIGEDNITQILQVEIGKVFVKMLEDAGVYKCTQEGRQAFLRFIGML